MGWPRHEVSLIIRRDRWSKDGLFRLANVLTTTHTTAFLGHNAGLDRANLGGGCDVGTLNSHTLHLHGLSVKVFHLRRHETIKAFVLGSCVLRRCYVYCS